MASEATSKLRNKWTKLTTTCFEPLTFGEIDIGQKYILLSEPDDTCTLRRLRSSHYIFEKIGPDMKKVKKKTSGKVNEPTGRAKRLKDGLIVAVPHSKFVILVE